MRGAILIVRLSLLGGLLGGADGDGDEASGERGHAATSRSARSTRSR